MSKVRNKDSKIEIAVRKILWKNGIRYRKNSTKYFGKPDAVSKKYKTVFFVDSCFFHGCKKHCKLPTSNVKLWKNKIEGNVLRDKTVNKYYKKIGWDVVRVWEHDVVSDRNVYKRFS